MCFIFLLCFCCDFAVFLLQKVQIKLLLSVLTLPPLQQLKKRLLPLEFVWRLFGICDQSSQLSPNLSKARASHNPGFTIRKVSSFKLIQLFLFDR